RGLSVELLHAAHADREDAATILAESTAPMKRETLLRLNTRIEFHEEKLVISIEEMTGDPAHRAQVDVPHQLQRANHAKLISIPAGDAGPRPDPTLVKLMAQAHAAQRMLMTGKPEQTVERFSKRHLYRLHHLSWLAPD